VTVSTDPEVVTGAEWRPLHHTLPGFDPTIGRLVGMLSYARLTLLEAVKDLTLDELDHLHDTTSNTIGALLAHAAAVEHWYRVLTFEERKPSASEEAPWLAALDLGEEGRARSGGERCSPMWTSGPDPPDHARRAGGA